MNLLCGKTVCDIPNLAKTLRFWKSRIPEIFIIIFKEFSILLTLNYWNKFAYPIGVAAKILGTTISIQNVIRWLFFDSFPQVQSDLSDVGAKLYNFKLKINRFSILATEFYLFSTFILPIVQIVINNRNIS